MSNLNSLLKLSPYSLKKSEKIKLFNKEIINLTKLHIKNCNSYFNILKPGFISHHR